MNEQKSKDLLNVYVLHKPDSAKLNRLENEVWRKISAIKAGQQENWLNKFLASVFVPQYRFATVALALIIGLTVGGLTKTNLPADEVNLSEMLDLQVFKVQDGHLPSNHIEGKI